MPVENFNSLRPVPVLEEVKTKPLTDVSFSPNLDFIQRGADIRFNVQLITGGRIRVNQCQFKTPGLAEQTIKISEQEIKDETEKVAHLESQLPGAIALSKGRKRFLFFTFGKTAEQKTALKNKRNVMKRQKKEVQGVEKKIRKKNKELKKFTDKNSISIEQRGILDRVITVQDFLAKRSKVKHKDFRQVKENIKALKLPLGLHISSLPQAFDLLVSHVRLLVPKYDDYVHFIDGYEEKGQHIWGQKDFESQLGQILKKYRAEIRRADWQIGEANFRANLADQMSEQIKQRFKKLGDLQVLISRMIVAKSFLSRIYINEGVSLVHQQLQQARNDLSQLKEAQESGGRVTTQASRNSEMMAMATSRVKELEKQLEITANPMRRLNQDDVPRDIRAAVQRVSGRNYDPTKVSETDRIFDEIVLTVIGQRSASIISPQWQDQGIRSDSQIA